MPSLYSNEKFKKVRFDSSTVKIENMSSSIERVPDRPSYEISSSLERNTRSNIDTIHDVAPQSRRVELASNPKRDKILSNIIKNFGPKHTEPISNNPKSNSKTKLHHQNSSSKHSNDGSNKK